MSSSKTMDLYRDFAAGVCLRARTPYHPPFLHTVYVYTVYLFSIHTGKGEEREPERRLEGQQFTKHGSKIQTHDLLYLQSINSAKHLP
jgi:hypothetical protein